MHVYSKIHKSTKHRHWHTALSALRSVTYFIVSLYSSTKYSLSQNFQIYKINNNIGEGTRMMTSVKQ